MADLAADHDAEVRFVSFPARRFPLPLLARKKVAAAASEADAIVLDSIAAAYWKGRDMPVPVAVMAHQPPGGIDHASIRTRVQAVLDRRGYRSADVVMVASRPLVDQMVAQGIRHDKIVVVVPGRDVAEPRTGVPSDLRSGRSIAVLCVGNWVLRKGILDLLEAVAALPDDAVTLHLVGSDAADPAYAGRVRSRLEDPNLRERVHVHGTRPKEDVAGMYRDADVFALPSIREPYGTVYGEAMAFGLPVVGWDAGNLPHLARHEREGLIVAPGDIEALARALETLARYDALRATLGENARRRAQTFPSWHDSARLFFTTIRALVEGRQ